MRGGTNPSDRPGKPPKGNPLTATNVIHNSGAERPLDNDRHTDQAMEYPTPPATTLAPNCKPLTAVNVQKSTTMNDRPRPVDGATIPHQERPGMLQRADRRWPLT